MSANSSKISLTLTDLENLNLGQLVRLYQAASGPTRTEPPTDQRSSQRLSQLSTSQLDLEGQDRGADFSQSSTRNSRAHLLASQRNSRHLSHAISTGHFDVERGEPLHDLGRTVKRNTSTPLLASQRNSRPLTPGQYSDAASEPDLEATREVPEAGHVTSAMSPRNSFPPGPGRTGDARIEPHQKGHHALLESNETPTPMSQYKPFHPNTRHLDAGRDLYNSRHTYPEPAFVSHHDVAAIPEEDAISPVSPVSSRWRSLRIARKPADMFRTWSWSRASTSRASRRSKRSFKIPRKPLPELFTWSGASDPNNPLNWSPWRKRMIVFAASAMTFAVTYASSVFSTAVTPMARQFHTSEEVMILGVSLYVLGAALGPLIFGPLSEVYGRTRPMFAGLIFFVVLQVPIALAQNLPAIFICRFLTGAAGASVIAIFPAMTVDLFTASDRGSAINLYLAAVFAGPCLGPVTGGFVVDNLDWRWTIWIVLIIAVVVCVIGFLVTPETCEAVLLQRKAAQVRYETKNWAMHTKWDEFPITWESLRQKYMLKPIVMLFQEPILLIITIYTSIVYGLLYMTFFAYPFSFAATRHWAPQLATLPFLTIFTGFILFIILIEFFFGPWMKRRLEARKADPMNVDKNPMALVIPEDRLPPMFFASILLPVGLFWFAWTSSPTLNYWPQVISGLFIGMGLAGIFASSISYLVDVYLLNANSALAANAFVRAIFGAAFPLFCDYMYRALGVDWATSLIGFVAVAMIPFPFLFWFKGKQIRGWSKFSFDL